MHSLFGSLRPPIAPTNCCFCEFLGPQKESLVLTSENYLIVYSVNRETGKPYLRFEHRFRLWSAICSLAKFRLLNEDYIILTFYPAKMAVVRFDRYSRNIEAVSMHDYSCELNTRGLVYSPHSPVPKVDPQNRCAAVLVLGNTLVIMPLESWIPKSGKPIKTYLIELSELHQWTKARVVDFCFLSGFTSPTMFLLCEPRPNWTGRLAVEKDTCASIAITINLCLQKSTVFWTNPELPYDSLYVLPVPSPLEGVVVVSNNAVL
ncbi:hypothetical protein ACOME3_000402 [Neoechinorhynchus agilis]